MRICRELLYWPRMSSRFEASHRTRGRSGRPARLTKNGWIPLAKSPEHNPCGKIYSHHSAKLDKTRTSTLTNSTTMHSVGSVCRLVVISPTVSGRFRTVQAAPCPGSGAPRLPPAPTWPRRPPCHSTRPAAIRGLLSRTCGTRAVPRGRPSLFVRRLAGCRPRAHPDELVTVPTMAAEDGRCPDREGRTGGCSFSSPPPAPFSCSWPTPSTIFATAGQRRPRRRPEQGHRSSSRAAAFPCPKRGRAQVRGRAVRSKERSSLPQRPGGREGGPARTRARTL